jgi:threonine aldolase
MPLSGFASDNYSGIHPAILEAIRDANAGHVPPYGSDIYTEKAVEAFKAQFGQNIDVYFVFNGTGANVLSLDSFLQPYQAAICAETAHIYVDECGAPERYTGCKLLPVKTPDGKLTPAFIEEQLGGLGDQHHVQAKVISISQTTELATLYKPQELKILTQFAHEYGLLVHMDGARLTNAAAALNVSLGEITTDVGIDVLSFGGTKCGMMCGEAVVFFDPSKARSFKYTRKQGMQLASKMRFIAAQFSALLANNLWLENATHANHMATLLGAALEKIPAVQLTQKVEANGVFAIIPPQIVERLRESYFFYTWNEKTSEVRLMTSFDTTKADIDGFIQCLQNLIEPVSV